MLIRGGSGAGGPRGALVAFAGIALASAGSWLIPGLTWRRIAAMGRPSAAAVQDTSATAPRMPLGVQIPEPEASADAPAALSLWARLSGLVGLALILGIGVALTHNRRAIR